MTTNRLAEPTTVRPKRSQYEIADEWNRVIAEVGRAHEIEARVIDGHAKFVWRHHYATN